MKRAHAEDGGPATEQAPQPVVDITGRNGYDSPIVQQTHQPQVEFRGRPGPDWSGVRALAAGQAGHFTAAQAKANGFSEQLLSKHVASGNLERPVRGIYRLSTFPPGENEDLVVAWLWTSGRGVISHESALQLHDLSDAMPARIHITLPINEAGRRRVVPPLYVLHYADIGAKERAWIGAVPVTTPTRTVQDVATAFGDAMLVAQAIEQGIRRGDIHAGEVAAGMAYAKSFDTSAWRVFPEAVADLGGSCAMHAFSGTCAKPPPADWPTLTREVVEGHGGRLYYQGHHPRSGTVSVHVAWPLPGPPPVVVDAVRHDLTRVLGWR